MASSGNSPFPSPIRTLAGAALVAIALSMAMAAGIAAGQQAGIDRRVIPIAPDAPERYVVQRGDTLWDISAKFLTDPWYWPEIWYVNPQVENPHLIYPGDVLALTWVDGQPRLVLESGGPVRLSPQVRESPLSEAIQAIPYDQIAAFMSRPTVLSKDQVEDAPYVAHARDHRLIASTGDQLYVRRLKDAQPGNRFNLYHVGTELKDPDDGDVLGYQGLFTGQADVRRLGDPASMLVIESARETLEGDILLPNAVEVNLDFIPRAPKSKIDGTIMALSDERTVTADHDIVIINRGSRDGLAPGDVLAIWEAGVKVRDMTDNAVSRKVQLPDERNGLCIIFKTHDRMSYGLIMEAGREVHVGDSVQSP